MRGLINSNYNLLYIYCKVQACWIERMLNNEWNNLHDVRQVSTFVDNWSQSEEVYGDYRAMYLNGAKMTLHY